jgi:hypothetical protein
MEYHIAKENLDLDFIYHPGILSIMYIYIAFFSHLLTATLTILFMDLCFIKQNKWRKNGGKNVVIYD